MDDRTKILLDTTLSNEDGVRALVEVFTEQQEKVKASLWGGIRQLTESKTLEAEVNRIAGVVEGLEAAKALVTTITKKKEVWK